MSSKVLGTSNNVLNDNSYRLRPQNINSKIMVTLLTKYVDSEFAYSKGVGLFQASIILRLVLKNYRNRRIIESKLTNKSNLTKKVSMFRY